MLTATTTAGAACRSAVADASVMSAGSPLIAAHTGSCPGASPNQTMIRLASGRQPMAGSVARRCSANSWPSGRSLPPSATQVAIAEPTSVASVVGESWCWKA